MADIEYDEQGTPTAPNSGKQLLWPDSSTGQWTTRNFAGRIFSIGGAIRNWNIADAVANAANTYLADAKLTVPQHGLLAGTTFRWRLVLTKTAAGVAAPIWTVVVGAAGSVADAVRLTFTGPVQTAAIDTGIVDITAILRNVGAAGVLAGGLSLAHNLAATGFANIGNPILSAVSAGFDTTAASLKVGLCVNPGAAGVWTHQVVMAEMLNI